MLPLIHVTIEFSFLKEAKAPSTGVEVAKAPLREAKAPFYHDIS
jgi:hypothetical protein